MFTLNSFQRGVRWRPFLSTRGETYPGFFDRKVQQGFERLARRNNGGKFFIPVNLPVTLPPFTALALPEMNVPASFWPEVGFFSDEELKFLIKGLARTILKVNPDISMKWKDCTDVIRVVLDMTKCLADELNGYSSAYGNGVRVSITSCNDGTLGLTFETTVSDILSFVYLAQKKELDSGAKLISCMFDEAVKLLGTICCTWRDIRDVAEDFYENCILPEMEVPGNYDEEDIKRYRESYAAIKAYPAVRFFSSRMDVKKRLKMFKRDVSRFKSKNGFEKGYCDWFRTVIEFLEDDPIAAIRNIHDVCEEESLRPELMFSILYDFDDRDAVTKYYCEEIDNIMQSGSGSDIVCHLKIPLKPGAQMECQVSELKHTLRALARLCRVFGFFNTKGKG